MYPSYFYILSEHFDLYNPGKNEINLFILMYQYLEIKKK